MRRWILLLFFSTLFLPVTYGQRRALSSGSLSFALQGEGLNVESILTMVQAGLSEEIVIARIRREGKAFDLSPEDLIRLKKASVTDNILKVMMDPKAERSVVGTPATGTPAQVVAPAPGIPALPGQAPSGATPAPGTHTPTGAENDPMTPHDSGIYLYTKDRDGKARMIPLERAAYQGAKTGGTFTAAMTYGIKKAKMKAIIPGVKASIRTDDTNVVFFFYFDDKAASLGKSYFGSTNLSSPNQFALVKLEVKKSNRETIIGEFGAFGSSQGTHEKSMVQFKSERIRSGLYKVTVSSMEQGEYCFLASSTMAGAFGSGAAAAMELFDFGVSTQ